MRDERKILRYHKAELFKTRQSFGIEIQIEFTLSYKIVPYDKKKKKHCVYGRGRGREL